MDLWTLALTFGLVARVTRFVTVDYLARWIRAYVIGKFGPDNDLAYGIACPWCFSIWAAVPVVLVGWFYGHTTAFQIVALVGLVSWLYGVVARNLDPIEDLNADTEADA